MLGRAHRNLVHSRRARVLSQRIASLIPRGATILDIGCGDGLIDELLLELRPDLRLRGIDTLVRPGVKIPVDRFDGLVIPHPENSFDCVLLIDAIHHADDPMRLLSEATRVAKGEVIIKDHLLKGFLAGPTLQLMDIVGNARYGVALPFQYWSEQTWKGVFAKLHLEPGAWLTKLGLYRPPFGLVFGRELHFITRLRKSVDSAPLDGKQRNEAAWELAYREFETSDEEVAKFVKRLKWAGADAWPRDARILELFCGRGNGLVALEKLGFTDVEGIDLSPSLLAHYRGKGRCRVGDCRELPFASGSKDVVIVQGGLHHLEDPEADVARVLGEARRVLSEGGKLFVVEPWLTPFLRAVHLVCATGWLRLLHPKLQALSTMIRHEAGTYFRWLGEPQGILRLLETHFQPVRRRCRWGKLSFVGTTRADRSRPLARVGT